MASTSKVNTIAVSLDSTITLNDGVQMPLFGLGMSKAESGVGGEAEKVVEMAIKHGYRLIDTAARYGNEKDVGRGMINSGCDREHVFVVTKIWHEDHGDYKQTKRALMTSLKKLQLDHIDLYLIHAPLSDQVINTYDAMLKLKAEGLIRSVGVSNFGIHHLEALKKAGRPAPSVNQIELHPWKQMREIVNYCRAHDIGLMGYSPLGKSKRMRDPAVLQMSQKYEKSYAQILIRWSIQMGYITIPKTVKESRIVENAQVFDFELEEQDLETMANFPDWSSAYVDWNPIIVPWMG